MLRTLAEKYSWDWERAKHLTMRQAVLYAGSPELFSKRRDGMTQAQQRAFIGVMRQRDADLRDWLKGRMQVELRD